MGIALEQLGIAIVVADIRAQPHIKAMRERKSICTHRVLIVGITKVPFAKNTCLVTSGLEPFGQSQFLGMKVT